MELSYLTDEEKQGYLDAIQRPEVFIDPEIAPYVAEINEIPFACTTQCCQGHPDGGYLSLRVAEEKAKWFEEGPLASLVEQGFDAVKRYENIGTRLIVRFIFGFDEGTRAHFFEELIKGLKGN